MKKIVFMFVGSFVFFMMFSASAHAQYPEIIPRDTSIVSYEADGDIIEIVGSCLNINPLRHWILVEAIAADDNSMSPYATNDFQGNCNSADGGLTFGQKCLFVNEDEGYEVPLVSVYPQCINGQFVFRIRLGHELPGKQPYTVRVKARTLSSAFIDSLWSEIKIFRSK